MAFISESDEGHSAWSTALKCNIFKNGNIIMSDEAKH